MATTTITPCLKNTEDLINNNVKTLSAAGSNFPLGASLAINTFLIDTTAGAGGEITGFRSNVFPSFGLRQMDEISEKGGTDEFTLGFAGNYGDKLYIGASLNVPSIHYERNRTYTEGDISNGSANNDVGFSYWTLTDRLKTDAVGFNAKLGLIYSPNGALRLGASFHTPTWYNMKDASTAEIFVDSETFDPDGTGTQRFQNTTDLTDGYPVEYEYNLRTPLERAGERLLHHRRQLFRRETATRFHHRRCGIHRLRRHEIQV
ncbi:outer membrane protein transport protein [Chitinophaga sedimenti]|uniref:outer membrane protein transport protein n=1 Tax=Chitinophaga sedimenti TaxID=2033606 RepID=UPI00200412A9|nr:outer membrane protein transport protein [Chitinophaga sedimenti]MCK7556194.1 outer membrane protein transport protein [Chitinophaga sedimenti]